MFMKTVQMTGLFYFNTGEPRAHYIKYYSHFIGEQLDGIYMH